MNKLILVYMTSASIEEAKEIARHLLEKKLIGCANIYSGIESMYFWEGKIAESRECILIAKTTEDKFEDMKKEVEKIHSYDIPCIVKIPVDANQKYADWIKKELIK